MSDFVDQEKLQALIQSAVDALRPLGLTVEPETVMIQMDGHGHMMAVLPALVRPEAVERAQRDSETNAEFQQMMAKNAQERIRAQQEEIASKVSDPEALMKALFSDEDDSGCSHERRHPEGFCLDCGNGLGDDFDALFK